MHIRMRERKGGVKGEHERSIRNEVIGMKMGSRGVERVRGRRKG